MSNGFGEGYFGMQVNAATERRILFSVWDPAAGQGITQSVRKGAKITVQRFGEGTGGQSYLVFDWKGSTEGTSFTSLGEFDFAITNAAQRFSLSSANAYGYLKLTALEIQTGTTPHTFLAEIDVFTTK
jgi:hypothetical protein